MISEVEYSIAKGIPVVVVIKEGIIKTNLPGIANIVIHWTDVDDLTTKIKSIDFIKL